MARREGRHRLAAVVQDLLPVDHQDGVALHEVVDLLAQPQRMDVAVLHGLLAPGALQLRLRAVGQRLAPVLVAVRVDLALDAASSSWFSTALQSPTMPMSTLRAAVAISSASMSMRAILASALKRGGAAWLMM